MPAVTSEYRLAVRTVGSADAIDIAKRRARDDGLRILTVRSCKLDALGRWAVCLAVEKA